MNPQEKDPRREERDPHSRADQREEKDRDERRQQKTDKPSRFGREAKIGLTAIALLLMALGGVVAMRVFRSDDKPKELASAADHENGPRPAVEAKEDLFKDMNLKSFNHGPTMVPPAKIVPAALPPSIDSDRYKWRSPPERSESKHVESRYAPPPTSPSVPPSFGSDPPKPATHGNRYGLAADDTLPGLEPEKPSRFAKKPKDLPPPPFPEEKKRPLGVDPVGSIVTRESMERGESSGYADAGSSPSARHREKSRNDDSSAALLPPPTYEHERPRHYDPPPYAAHPPRHDDGKYEVQPGETYWTISEKLYGSSGYFKALAEENRGKFGNVDSLRPGDVISAPPLAQLESTYPEYCPRPSRRETQESRTLAAGTRNSYRNGRTYTVTEGDTLFNIARYELGKASRWVELYDLNRDVLGKDFNYLTPGLKLVLPDNEKTDVLTRKSDDLYR